VCDLTIPNESVTIFQSLILDSPASAARAELKPNFKIDFGLGNNFLWFYKHFSLKPYQLSFPTVPFSPLDTLERTHNKIESVDCAMQSPVFLLITSPKPNPLDPPPRGTRVVESRSTNLMGIPISVWVLLRLETKAPFFQKYLLQSFIPFLRKIAFLFFRGDTPTPLFKYLFKTLRFAILPGYVVVPKIIFIIFLLLTLLLKLSEGILQPRFSNFFIFSEGILQPRFSNFFQNYFLSRFDPWIQICLQDVITVILQ